MFRTITLLIADSPATCPEVPGPGEGVSSRGLAQDEGDAHGGQPEARPAEVLAEMDRGM